MTKCMVIVFLRDNDHYYYVLVLNLSFNCVFVCAEEIVLHKDRPISLCWDPKSVLFNYACVLVCFDLVDKPTKRNIENFTLLNMSTFLR